MNDVIVIFMIKLVTFSILATIATVLVVSSVASTPPRVQSALAQVSVGGASQLAPGHEAIAPGDAKNFAPGQEAGIFPCNGCAKDFAPGQEIQITK